MTGNYETQLAWQFIANTNISVFLTGKAGTGKTTFLRKLRDDQPKRMAVVAPTGVAAINAQGMTIHSFFQLPLGPHLPGHTLDAQKHYRMSQEKKDIIKTLDLLVIDEISMVRCDLLDSIDEVLRRYKNRHQPFGGVQLLLIGDLQQLPPVTKDAEWEILKHYYDTPYFYGSKALSMIPHVTIELKKVYRQTDTTFINLLGKIRNNQLTDADTQALNSRYIPDFAPPKDEDWIRLTTHNASASQYNEAMLSALKSPSQAIHAKITGTFPEHAYPADSTLVLKKGAQVMFIKNDPSGTHEYYNGKIGTVIGFEDEQIIVESKEDDSTIYVSPVTWDNTKYTIDPETKEIKEESEGTFTQFPLRLAWAITIHKSQGLTFDRAVLDINASFAHGQAYVALSRCRTLDGLVLAHPIRTASIISDSNVTQYMDSQLHQSEQTQTRLPELQFDYFCHLLDECFDFTPIKSDLSYLRRIAEEHLYKSNANFLTLVSEISAKAETDIFAVSVRFKSRYHAILQTLQVWDTSNSHLQERIQAASNYFTSQMIDIFTQLFQQSTFTISNKAVMKQFSNAVSSLTLSYKVKLLTLLSCAEHGFCVRQYLRDKASAQLSNIHSTPSATKKARIGGKKK